MVIEGAVIIGIVVGLTQAIKLAGMPTKYIPAIAVILGVILSFTIGAANLGMIIIQGLIYGLSACGLYSGVKATVAGSPQT